MSLVFLIMRLMGKSTGDTSGVYSRPKEELLERYKASYHELSVNEVEVTKDELARLQSENELLWNTIREVQRKQAERDELMQRAIENFNRLPSVQMVTVDEDNEPDDPVGIELERQRKELERLGVIKKRE